MVSVCFYFQVHQPYRLGKYSVFDIGNNSNYFDERKNREILDKVVSKCYLPANKLIKEMIHQTRGRFKASFSFSGVVLEQLEALHPEVIEGIAELLDTGCVELLNETYHHSLAFIYSKQEFREQVELHKKIVKRLFSCKPEVFRNTELIFNNELAKFVEDMGFSGILAEGADHILGWRSPDFVYCPKTANKIRLLLKNYKLSDDIAFRFSERTWKEWPLTAPKFAKWVNGINGNGNVVNLFMDYETFGEHQWQETGIFDFLKHLPQEILKHEDNNFMTTSEAIHAYEPVAELDVHNLTSWADVERDLSAWVGNKMQRTAIYELYKFEEAIKKSKNQQILNDWRKLQTSDHFYYMCTKWFADGDVHKYFNPYDSPYDSFIAFMNAIQDLNSRIEEVDGKKQILT